MIVHASVGIMPHDEVVYLCDCLISFAARSGAGGSQVTIIVRQLAFLEMQKCRYPIDPFGCICLFQRLSHARLSTYSRKVKPRMAH